MTTPQLIATSELESVTRPLNQASTLPPAAYKDVEVFALETKHIFHQDWHCVARVDQIPEKGDFLSVDLFDQPIVLVRTTQTDIKALSRVCLHRAMPLVEGQGNATRFVCPYHKWTYELDGALRSAPMMGEVEEFVTKDCRLPELKTEIWLGFVFVSMNIDAEPLLPRLSKLSDSLAVHSLEKQVVVDTIEFDSPWNWKLLVENFMEAYHHIGPHENSFEPFYPARSSFTQAERGTYALLRMPTADSGPNFPDLPDVTELLAGVVFPMFLFAASEHSGIWYQLEPSAQDQMRLRIHILQEPDVHAAMSEEARIAHREMVRVIHLEDIGVNEGPWKGQLAPMTKQGRLSTFEESIWQLNQYWVSRLKPYL